MANDLFSENYDKKGYKKIEISAWLDCGESSITVAVYSRTWNKMDNDEKMCAVGNYVLDTIASSYRDVE